MANIKKIITPFDLSGVIVVIAFASLFIYSLSPNIFSILFAIAVFAGLIAHIIEKVKSKEPFVCKYLIGISVALCIAALWIFVSYLIYLTAHFLRKF